MRFGSVCSGIEAASLAWSVLGWQAAFLAEIDRFPCAVLAHHHPKVPNHGDMTRFAEWPDHAIDLLVGGTPCQSFSVAGLRAGLADPRGNLMLTYLAIAARYHPRWLVWENVPGVLSIDGGRAFGALLGGLGQLGYGFAYRVLDAQFCRALGYAGAVPQRRRRVFVIGYLGDWRRAAAVLFDAASLRGDHPPRRETGQGIAGTIDASAHRSRGAGISPGGLIPDISVTLTARDRKGPLQEADLSTVIVEDVAPTLRAGGNRTGGDRPSGTDVDTLETLVAHSLLADGFDASEDGSGRGTPIVPVVADTLTAYWDRSKGAKAGNQVAMTNPIIENLAVRRLTPTECERLQGFPDGYTQVPFRSKPAADGPRYKALGNSMAVNAMRVLGARIQMVEAIL